MDHVVGREMNQVKETECGWGAISDRLSVKTPDEVK